MKDIQFKPIEMIKTLNIKEQLISWFTELNGAELNGEPITEKDFKGCEIILYQDEPIGYFKRRKHPIQKHIQILNNFLIDKDWRHQGFGSKTLDLIIAEARSNPHFKYLTLGVFDDNLNAKRLYASKNLSL